MSVFINALKREIGELEADIKAHPDPRLRKVQRLRETLAEYEPIPLTPLNGSKLEPLPAASGPSALSKVARIKGFVDGTLQAQGKAHRAQLLAGLIQAGIMGNEKKPMQALAIFLSSNRDDYVSDGAGNYALRNDE
jgi:hypothetical protein